MYRRIQFAKRLIGSATLNKIAKGALGSALTLTLLKVDYLYSDLHERIFR